jgi:glycosyltransferase involved in cell wall biosynthesis
MKRILVISPIPTNPQIAANRVRIHRLLTCLREMEHDVHFLYVNTEPDYADEEAMKTCWGNRFYWVPYRYPKRSLKRYAGRLKFLFEKGFKDILPVDYRYDASLDEFLVRLSEKIKFDVVIVEYIFWSRALELFSRDQVKIIDTHDVFTKKHRFHKEAGQEYSWYTTTAKEEAKGLNRADIIIAIQEREKEFFKSLTRKRITVVGTPTSLHKSPERLSGEKRILFVGSDNESNIHGINHFITEIYPTVKSAVPSVSLVLVGKICDKVDQVDRCVKLGVLEDLTSVYDGIDLVIDPIVFGTGISTKTVEALGHGKPVVTMSAGSRGLEKGANKAFLIADTPVGFSQSVIRILTDSQLSGRLARAAYEFAEKWNQEALSELASILG